MAMKYYLRTEDSTNLIGFLDETTGVAPDEVVDWSVVATYKPAELNVDSDVPLRDQDLIAFAKGVAAEILTMDAVVRAEYLIEYMRMVQGRRGSILGNYAATRLSGVPTL